MPTTIYRNPCVAERLERHIHRDGPILLNLYECEVVDEDLHDLSADDRVASRLRILNLIENPVGRWVGGMKALGRCPVLKILKLHGCRMAEANERMSEFREGLAACESVRAVGLGYNGLTPAMLKTALARGRHITVLHLPGNELDDAAGLVDAIAPLTELAYLNLSCNFFSDAATLVEGLAHLKRLTSLRLSGCPNLKDTMPFRQASKSRDRQRRIDFDRVRATSPRTEAALAYPQAPFS